MPLSRSSVRRLERAMVRAIQDVGDVMFTETQRLVNVDRGTLKKSGYITYLPNGVRIGYRAPYAARVNYGLPSGYTENVKRHSVRSHTIRSHKRLLRNGSTIRVQRYIQPKHERGPFTRVFRKGVKGSHYFDEPIERIRQQAPRIIAARLRRELSG